MGFFAGRISGMTPGGIAGLIAVTALLGTGGFLWGTRFIQVTPEQCASCHPQLTAMWERSQGHPADRVSCHDCHAEHAALPASGNLLAYARDELIPAAYWSTEATIESRCEGCHTAMREQGSGPELIRFKQALTEAQRLGAEQHWEGLDVPVDARTFVAQQGSGLVASGADLLAAAARSIRDDQWRQALQDTMADASETLEVGLARVRDPLAFSTQALQWARLDARRVQRGVAERVGARVNQYKWSIGKVRRSVQGLQDLLAPLGADPTAKLSVTQRAQAVASLEDASKGLKGAGRARNSLVKDLPALEDAFVNPDELARALRGVPEAIEQDDLASVRQALDRASQLLAPISIDAARVEREVEVRAAELAGALQGRLQEVRAAFEAVLADLPAAATPAVQRELALAGAEIRRGRGERVQRAPAAEPAGELKGPRDIVRWAATSVRALRLSVESIPGLGWGDLSLREDHLEGLLDRFDGLAEAIADAERGGLARAALRRRLEAALAVTEGAWTRDGAELAVFASSPDAAPGEGAEPWFRIAVKDLLDTALVAFLEFERDLERRKVVKANHKVHFLIREDSDGKPVDLGCLDCHRNIAHDKAQIETNRPPMTSCFAGSCHLKDRNRDNCLRCHYQQLTEPGQEG